MTGPAEAGAAFFEADPLTSSEMRTKSINGTRWKKALATLKDYGFDDEPTLIALCEIYLPEGGKFDEQMQLIVSHLFGGN